MWGRTEGARTNVLKPAAFYADLKFEFSEVPASLTTEHLNPALRSLPEHQPLKLAPLNGAVIEWWAPLLYSSSSDLNK